MRLAAPALRRLMPPAPVAAFLAVVVVYYVFLMSAGQMTRLHGWSAFVDSQAEGLRAGHLSLAEQPTAALKALKNPYDPANMRYWRWDHTYYAGRLYLYWGMVPGLLLALVKTVFRIRHTVGDQTLVFAFALGRLLVGTLLLRALAARAVPRPPSWAVAAALAVFAVASPMPYTLNRGAVYEVAIMAGVFFALAGIACGLQAMSAVDPRRATRWLVAASVGFGLAGGSRISLLPTVVLLALVAGLVRWRIDGGGARRLLTAGLAAAAPAALLIGAHLLLNRLRFDAWTEFGARYQMGHPALKTGLRFLLPDVFAYFFCPPSHGCAFPFLSGKWNTTRPLSPSWLTWPEDHHTPEPTTGLLVVVPFAWLALAGVALVAVRRWRRHGEARASASPAPAASPSPSPSEIWRRRWPWLALVIYTFGAAAPLLLLSSTSMRYELDFSSGLLLLATLGGWSLLASTTRRATRAIATAAFATLAATTVIAGVLLGFGGYFDHFGRHNPALWHTLQEKLSVCGAD
jgi:hypothetical protein